MPQGAGLGDEQRHLNQASAQPARIPGSWWPGPHWPGWLCSGSRWLASWGRWSVRTGSSICSLSGLIQPRIERPHNEGNPSLLAGLFTQCIHPSQGVSQPLHTPQIRCRNEVRPAGTLLSGPRHDRLPWSYPRSTAGGVSFTGSAVEPPLIGMSRLFARDHCQSGAALLNYSAKEQP